MVSETEVQESANRIATSVDGRDVVVDRARAVEHDPHGIAEIAFTGEWIDLPDLLDRIVDDEGWHVGEYHFSTVDVEYGEDPVVIVTLTGRV